MPAAASPSNGEALQGRAAMAIVHASRALELLRHAIQTSERWDVFYAIRSRAKSHKSIVEKVYRKRADKPSYEPDNITDIIGFRIITLFRDDIMEAVLTLAAMIAHRPPFESGSPFVKGKLYEANIYYTSGPDDPVVRFVKSLFDTSDFRTLKNKEVKACEIHDPRYSSVHLVAWCGVPSEDGGIAKVPVEIQIRTVFEDAWGEVDHKLRYAPFRSLSRGIHDPRYRLLDSLLTALKRHSEGSAQGADIARELLRDIVRRDLYHPERFKPVETFEEVLSEIGELPSEMVKLLKTSYKVRDRAIQEQDEGRISYRTTFREASSSFMKILDKPHVMAFLQKSTKEAHGLWYFCQMEAAFCLLAIGKEDATIRAAEIYSTVRRHNRNDVVLHYRYGQALAVLGHFDGAAQEYREAIQLLLEDASMKASLSPSKIYRKLGLLE